MKTVCIVAGGILPLKVCLGDFLKSHIKRVVQVRTGQCFKLTVSSEADKTGRGLSKRFIYDILM